MGVNQSGAPLFERGDGLLYRINHGRADVGGDLALIEGTYPDPELGYIKANADRLEPGRRLAYLKELYRHFEEHFLKPARDAFHSGEMSPELFAHNQIFRQHLQELIDETTAIERGAPVDPAIAERQRQQADLGAKSPLQANAEQSDTGGLGLFDHANEPTFDLDDGKGPRTAADIDAEIQTAKAGLEAMRQCLK